MHFAEDYGHNISDQIETPTDIFLQLFPESLIESIVFQTNLYALQKHGKTSAFKATSKEEMGAFLAVNLLMGIKKLPSYRDYWSSRPELRDLFISQTLSRDRFIWLHGHFHLNDNSVIPSRESPNYDKLYKVRPVLDTLSKTFMNCYKPSKNQSIDESMIRFKGRSTLKQYMPQKPIKRGYKVVVSRGRMVTPEKPKKSRWRKRNIEGRAKVKSRTGRDLGYSYIDAKGRQRDAKVLGPPCQCKKNCRQLLQGTASKIFNSFWDLESYEKQNTYLFATIKVNGVDSQICKTDFLSLHGLQKSSKRLKLIAQQIYEGRTTPKRDGRGKHHNRPNKTPTERVQSVHDHIQAIPKYQTLSTPSLTVGPAFYSRKAWTYNLGIYDCDSGQGSMFLWAEPTAKRGSDEIASILLKYLTGKSALKEDLVVFTDNCGGQNKNWVVMSLWLQLVREKYFKLIEHRFLISGQTHLASDRDFAIIEKHKKYVKQVYCPDDWVDIIRKSNRKKTFKTVLMEQQDFYAFDSISITKRNVTINKQSVRFNQVRCFKFDSNHPNSMFIKHTLNGEFIEVNVGKRCSRLADQQTLKDLKREYKGPITLNDKKIGDLKKLMKYIPTISQQYFINIIGDTASEAVAGDEQLSNDSAEDIDGDEEMNNME
nr:unnamed protein product [Callosobruchus chinensis]